MSNFYQDSKFGVIHRKWFGLTKKWGGDVATGYNSVATKGATAVEVLAYWYPRGPIRMLKGGSMVLATLTNASTDSWPITMFTRGASASTAFAWNLKNTSTAIAPAVIASDITPTVSQVKAGEYISVRTSTPVTDDGTAVAATTTGTFAVFVDYVNTFDQSGKHDS